MPQPAIEMPICPVGTKTARSPAARAAAASSSVTVILPIAQSVPTVCTMRAGTPRPAPLGVERPAGTRAEVAQLEPARRSRGDQVGIAAELVVQPGLDVQAERERLEQRVLPFRRQLAACGRDADREALRAERGGLGDRRRRSGPACPRTGTTSFDALPGVQRVDDGHDLALAVADEAVRGLAVRRVQNRPRRRPRRARSRRAAPRRGPGRCESTMRPSSSRVPRPGRRRSAGGRRGRRSRRATRTAPTPRCRAELSIMQPSMTTRPSARAACTMRTASRMPPVFASLRLTPSA